MRHESRARATQLLLVLVVTACGRSIAPVYHGVVSDHFDGKQFFNYERTPERQIEDAIRRQEPGRHRGHWDKWQDTPTDTPPSRVAARAFESQSLRPHGPADAPTAGRTISSARRRRAWQQLVPREEWRRRSEDVDWWQSVGIAPGVRLTAVPARHWSARSTNDVDRTLWLGFVLQTPSGRIYFAGDTGYGQFFSMLHDRFPSFRLALLPIAPARPRAAMATRHMSAGDAVRAAQQLHVETAVAIHFGTFQQGDDGEQEPVDSLAQALSVQTSPPIFLALRNGEAQWIRSACEQGGGVRC